MGDTTTPEPQLNRAGRRAEHRRLRKAGALMAAIPAAFGTTALMVGAATTTAGAANPWTVTELGDAGDGTCDATCTLRDAIGDAADGDTVTFEAGLTGTITLTGGIDILVGMTITGPGADLAAGGIVVDGDGNGRIFDIDTPDPGNAEVVISGLGLTGGEASTGGAIRFYDANLTLRDVVITGNSASNDGGGIATEGEDLTLTIERSVLSGNTAGDDGGAVYFYVDGGTFVMTDSVVADNEANDEGGGLMIATEEDGLASVTITGGEISGNDADGRGGGLFIYNVDGDVTITGATISGNTAGDGGGGIGVQNVDGATSFSNLLVSDNHVPKYDDGGGVYFEYVADATISGSTFTGNSAYDGGAIEWIRSYDLLIRNSTLSGNTAVRGGGLYNSTGNYGNVTIVNSTISGNVTTGTEYGNGGAIRQGSYYTLTIIQSTITDNTGPEVGGIDIRDSRDTSTGLAANDARQAARDAERAEARAAEGRTTDQEARARSGRVHQAAGTGQVDVVGSIVQGNHGADIGLGGTAAAASSLLGTITGTTFVDQGGNLTGVDPLLGPLQDNGGPTSTHALLDGSPAINTGPDPLPDFPGNADDQRGPGYARVVGGRVDIGAFEVQPTALEPTFTG